MDTHLHISEDGSHTVYSNKYQAHYHSLQGALEESIHIFLASGLYYQYRHNYEQIQIFEMGFGTGLNAFLTLLEAKKYNLQVSYTAVESDPIPQDMVTQLNYPALLHLPDSYSALFERLHQLPWGSMEKLTPHFEINKIHGKIEDIALPQNIDIIYFDAFAPSCQSQLWEETLHKRLFNMLNANGILVTYCTQGAFKRMLASIGYALEKLNGPGRKREMLRAKKSV